MDKLKYVVLAGMCALLSGPDQASAKPDDVVQRVRMSVSRYALDDGGVVDVLGELTQYLAEAGTEMDEAAREVSFLRAAATADLMFVAAYTDDQALLGRVTSAWGEGETLRDAVAAELRKATGIYQSAAARILASLGVFESQGGFQKDAVSAARGSWRDILFLREVAGRIGGAESVEGVLGALGQDPCAGIRGGCGNLFMTFDAGSRRALSVLSELGKAKHRLDKARSQGDPLVNVLAEAVEADYTHLARLELRLAPMLRPDMHVKAEGEKPAKMPVDLLVLLEEGALRYGYVPRMGLDAEGNLVSRATGEPSLPAMASITYPSSFRPYMRPMESVVEALQGKVADPGSMVAGVTAVPGVASHILGRVLLSLNQVGFENAAVIGPGTSGSALGVPLRVLAARDADALRPQPEVRVRVRLGGYSLHMGFGLLDIPRIRGEEGLAFDKETLQARVSRRRIHSASVSFMSDVAVENLLSAVWRVAPEKESLNFVLP